MTRHYTGLAVAFGVMAASVPGIASTDAIAQALAPHRAVYDVALANASDRSGITGMHGRIVYEFQGSACDGYTTVFRFVTRIRSATGNRLSDQQTSTYEDGSGDTFRFVTKSFVDERLDRELSGSAIRDAEGIVVTLKKPEKAEFSLAPALFPSAHMIDLLNRAHEGEKFYETAIFDGTENGDRIMTTSVVIGPEKTGAEGDGANAGPLKDDSFRNVSISYFDEGNAVGGEAVPEYQISFKLYDNGVTRDLVMDYGDFVLEGALRQIEMLPKESCD
ncbi:cell envelope integrity EipB family protein [Oricola thermophila]|uniref:Cell envelope integrity EipB family protein n=1 Tax=Oricola thermophila TaxID=2742145 RepID=A0A6N1VBN2_9HYPH|nr:cell envelope integrity EipB family protein [Oricola thermophila]QKV18098.1 cell envelope integrity EipB family protein [Oricola thermophila]